MESNQKKIPCSVGILTYNSSATLERALKSLDGFGEIIVSDGGSTDDTLATARKYSCKIISQSNPGHPIENFSIERNKILDAASNDWFFYLDSDEVITHELKERIRIITANQNPPHLLYRVRYYVVNPDLSVRYRVIKPSHQIRFFNITSGARFRKRMHEKILFDKDKFSVGTLEEAWLVPLDVQLNFAVYKHKVHHRLGIITDNWSSRNPLRLLSEGLFLPLWAIIKILFRGMYMNMRYPSNEVIPLRYEFYRMYSQVFMMRRIWRRYFKILFGRAKI